MRENCGNGFVTQVDLLDTDDVLPYGVDRHRSQPAGQSGRFHGSLGANQLPGKGVKIYVDTDHELWNWEEIDAVQLLGTAPTATYVQTSGTTTLAGGTLDADVDIQGGALAGTGPSPIA